MIDLLSELRAATFSVRQPHLDRLKCLGVSIAWMADWAHDNLIHPFGVVTAEDAGDGLYQPGEGALHVILPVVEDGELVDLVAFRSTDSGSWMLRTGNGWALGLEKGLSAHMWGQTVHLFSDPLDWLRGRGEGVCVLDWDAAEVHNLDVLQELVCSSPAVAALLTRALSRPARLPKLKLMETRNVA